MSARHTPGPWQRGGRHSTRYGELFAGGSFAVLPALGHAGPVAICAGEANARLIAAAPDLLEASDDAQDTIVKLIADLREEDADRHAQRIAVLELTLAQLEAAIAKARGQ